MRHRTLVTAILSALLSLCASTAHAQVSFCLRPLGIPDKWIERQTPPWDPTDTFDPTGTNPDMYIEGFEPSVDHGVPMTLTLYTGSGAVQGQSALPIVVSESWPSAFRDAIISCSGYPHSVGETFPIHTGVVTGPLSTGMHELIMQDPGASWDPGADGGRGGVVNSAFAVSPRIIALPVFAPDGYGAGTAASPAMVKIVGFFVSSESRGVVSGYLTAASQLEMPAVTARVGEYAQLSATFSGPGSPLAGVPIEFVFDGQVVATGETDGTGTARPATMAFAVPLAPGEYPGVLAARLAPKAGFYLAEPVTADLTVLRKRPLVTWAPPAAITYGTVLGPQQLNATADVPGTFSYSPSAGTVLTVHETDPVTLSVTFVPEDQDFYEETTETTWIFVNPAPLALKVTDTQKLYLDALPAFSYSATGFVNGEGPSVLIGSLGFETTATSTSPVGTYAVRFNGAIGAENYFITLTNGTLTIIPRPTATTVQTMTPSPSIFGQTVTVTVDVSSGVGQPGGIVTLVRGDVAVATGSVVDGRAVLSVSKLEAGIHPLSAQYSGGAGFAASASPFVSHTVAAAATATQVTSSVNPSRAGQAVTFTALVAPVAPGAGVPAGTVEFLRGSTVIGTATLSGGIAQFVSSTLAVGKHTIQARYLGSTNHLGSMSAALQQSVKGGGK